MKALPVFALTLSLPSLAQPAESTVIERGPHHKVVQTITIQSDEQGNARTTTNSYTALATGMHYVKDGQWLESSEEFKEAPDAFVAAKGQHQLFLKKNVNAPASVELVLPDGQRLISNPMGLSFFDPTTGKNVLLGEVKDCLGELIAPDIVLFADAFTDIRGAIKYSYTKTGFSQDIILYDDPGSPTDYGLDPATTLLEMYSEFHNPPAPTRRSRGDLQDEALDFGQMEIGSGVAYVLNQELNAVRVFKTWTKLDARDFLVESIAFIVIEPLLKNAGLQAGKGSGQKFDHRDGLASALKRRPGASRLASAQPGGSPPARGLVLDYSTINTAQTNFLFAGSTNFYLSGNVSLYGTNTTFEGGTILKYTNGVKLTVNTPVTWLAEAYRPVLMLSKDDDSAGQAISGSTGNPSNYLYATTALYLDANAAGASAAIQNLRVANAQTAVALNGRTNHLLSHVQLVNCQNGIAATNAEFKLRNALFHNVLTNFTGSASTGRVEHLTVNTASWLNKDIGANLFLTNSLLVAVTNYGSFSSNAVYTASGSVFQSVGAGSHYLANNTYRNLGTTNVSILSELRKLTTYPPIVLTNTISVNATLQPQAQRDTDVPDIGYHADPIDWAVNTLVVTNTTLTLTNGVAVATFGNGGLWLRQGSRLVSEGTALVHNHLCRYNTVQEQSTNWANGSVTGNASLFLYNPNVFGTNCPSAEIRFTDFDGLSAGGWHIYTFDGSWMLWRLTLRDCTFNSASVVFAGSAGAVLALNNNLFERVDNQFLYYPQIDCYNNLFKGGVVFFERDPTAGTWTVRDNSFDSCQPANEGASVTLSHNAYINATSLGGSNNVELSGFNYASGPLAGRYYQASTNLYDAGSRAADLAGLYHHTVKTSQAKETTSTVDIGFHYAAVDGSSVPVDTDGDGFPDYFEDRNGNGTYDSGSGETDWQTSNNGLTGVPGLQTFTPLK